MIVDDRGIPEAPPPTDPAEIPGVAMPAAADDEVRLETLPSMLWSNGDKMPDTEPCASFFVGNREGIRLGEPFLNDELARPKNKDAEAFPDTMLRAGKASLRIYLGGDKFEFYDRQIHIRQGSKSSPGPSRTLEHMVKSISKELEGERFKKSALEANFGYTVDDLALKELRYVSAGSFQAMLMRRI
ncbi:hypothetical protein WOLCODRAFT_161736 [Wolfiporia cocos MD-104 SS10]|uniref:Uncharacterized protein n=1 Tax=Wolfiporia cocos (strain MD-104) TaxID=742152 RepID=A0A2H3J8T1_WOLCO|nr:hypothetical protein WOLCODRAFT_161736 [Wolfiporia cocos MD-104 SS10]